MGRGTGKARGRPGRVALGPTRTRVPGPGTPGAVHGRIGAAGEPAGADPPHGGRTTPPGERPMNETFARRLTGIAGIATATALIVEVPLYFVYSGPPPDANALARLLIGIVALASLIVFVTVFRELVKLVGSGPRVGRHDGFRHRPGLRDGHPRLQRPGSGRGHRRRPADRPDGHGQRHLRPLRLDLTPHAGALPGHGADGRDPRLLAAGCWLLAAGRGRLGLARRRTGRRQPARMRNR